MKIALVHDYLREYGGAERVLETIHEMLPEARAKLSEFNFPSLIKRLGEKEEEENAGKKGHKENINEKKASDSEQLALV